MYWKPMMHKNPNKTRLKLASAKSSIKPLARTATSIFRLFYVQIQKFKDNVGFLLALTLFG